MPNFDRLDAVLAVIDRLDAGDPDHNGRLWDQSTWRSAVDLDRDEYITDLADVSTTEHCGTAMCFAGWTCELDPDTEWADAVSPYTLVDGQRIYADTRAMFLLGLDEGQVDLLFDATNTRETLHRIVRSWRAGPALHPVSVEDADGTPAEIPGLWQTLDDAWTLSRSANGGYDLTYNATGNVIPGVRSHAAAEYRIFLHSDR